MRLPDRRRTLHAALLLGLTVGCANPPPTPEQAKSADKPAAEKPAADKPAAEQPPFQSLTFPAPDPTGPDRQVDVVLDAPPLKVVSIALRRGTLLPEHTAPVPVIIQAAAGAGHAVLGDQRVRLDSEHAVTLAPNVPHAVEPDAGTDLTLHVFHLRGSK